MTDITNISSASSAYRAASGRAVSRGAKENGSGGAERALGETDSVELSGRAQLLSRLRELPDIREDLVAEVRAKIESGVYETPEKVEAAIDAILEDTRTLG